MRRNILVSAIAAVGLVLAVAGVYAKHESATQQHVASLPAVSANGAPTAVTALPDFTGLVDKYGPAVVNISVTGKVANAGALPNQNDPAYDFFRQFGIPV